MHALGPLFSDFASGPSSTPERALQLTSKAKNHFGVLAGMHLNCTNKSSEMTGNALLKCKQRGVHGHPLGTAGGFSSALDLLKFIRQNHDDYFSVSVVDSDAKFMVRFSDVGKTVLAMIYAGRPMRCLGRLLAHPRLRGGLMGQRRVAFRVLVRSLLVPAPPPPAPPAPAPPPPPPSHSLPPFYRAPPSTSASSLARDPGGPPGSRGSILAAMVIDRLKPPKPSTLNLKIYRLDLTPDLEP
ncbi:unnamed protein product [Symbiodinium sp. KB8]|nr:unnamed protein product [Symbiodinium sp. KB8]